MKRILLLLFIAILVFVIILVIKRPDIIGNFWLWILGLAGPVIATGKRIINEAKKRFPFRKEDAKPKPVNKVNTVQ